MWILFALIAVFATVCNVVWTFKRKDASVFCFIALAFTALTLCSVGQMVSGWVTAEDWSALVDVVPTMTKTIWGCSIASILINGVSLLKKR